MGKKEWIEACNVNCCPQYSIGRPMKIDKETIAGLVKAVELFVSKDYDAEIVKWENLSLQIFENLKEDKRAEVRTGYPAEPGIQPTNILRVYIRPLRKSAAEVYEELTELPTPIYTHLDKEELVINPQCLRESEIQPMCRSIAALL